MVFEDRRFTGRGFSKFLGVKRGTVLKRMWDGEVAFAFGLDRPAVRDEYWLTDAAAFLLADMLSGLGRIPLRHTAAMVRSTWPEWPRPWAISERTVSTDLATQQFFGVGLNSRNKYVGAAGTMKETVAALEERGATGSPNLLQLPFVIGTLRINAQQAGIEIGYVFPDPDNSADFEEWLRHGVKRKEAA